MILEYTQCPESHCTIFDSPPCPTQIRGSSCKTVRHVEDSDVEHQQSDGAASNSKGALRALVSACCILCMMVWFCMISYDFHVVVLSCYVHVYVPFSSYFMHRPRCSVSVMSIPGSEGLGFAGISRESGESSLRCLCCSLLELGIGRQTYH